jgi:hypothetical protein
MVVCGGFGEKGGILIEFYKAGNAQCEVRDSGIQHSPDTGEFKEQMRTIKFKTQMNLH